MRVNVGVLLGLSMGCVNFADTQGPPPTLDSTTDVSPDTSDTSGPSIDSGADTGEVNDSPDTGADTGQDTTEPKDDGLEPAGDYSERGPFTPGNWESALVGSTGANLYVDVWYPSSEVGGTQRYYGWSSWYFEGDSFSNIAPDCSEPRPVIVHSHGNSSIRWEMFYLPEFLSTHGWIVVAPDHEGNTLYDGSADFVDVFRRRPKDLTDTYDWLVQLSQDPGSELYGCVDEAAGFVVSGYSFGGYTALVTGGGLVNEDDVPVPDISDDRVTAVVTFAPWNAYGLLSDGTAAIEVPVLTYGAERDDTVGTQYMGLHSPIESEPRALAIFHNAGHYTFTPIYCSFWGDGCGYGYIEVDDFVPMFRTSMLAWLEHLRGRTGAIEQLPPASSELSWELVD